MMPGDLRRILLSLTLLLGLAGLWAYSCARYEEGRISRTEQVAQQKKEEADGHAAAARQAEARVQARASELDQLQAEVDRLRAKLARPSVGRPAVVPVSLPPVPDAAVVDQGLEEAGRHVVDGLRAQLADQAELIQAQDKLIQGLKFDNADLRAESDHWQKAFQAERDRATSIQLALDAQKHVNQASRWRGRFEGFAVGVALGYVGGRR